MQCFNFCFVLYSTMSGKPAAQRRPILPPPQATNVQPSTSKTTPQPQSTGTSRPDLEGLSRRERKRLREQQNSSFLEHPFSVKFQNKKTKILVLIEQLWELADNDMIVCDRDTGLNDYTKNLKFADELEDLSKVMAGVSSNCSQRASKIRERIDDLKEDKRQLQDVVFMQEVLKESEKEERARLRTPKPFVKTHEFRIKRERPLTVSSDEEEEPDNGHGKKKNKKQKSKGPVYSGDVDTKFAFPKENEYDEVQHPDHICVLCDKTLRDRTELRNHMSNHHKELFRCMKCSKFFRTEVSFQAHVKTHYAERYKCPEPDCGQIFELKTSWINHKQKHSEEKMTCKKCGRKYQFRSTFLEHTRYRHLAAKSIPCPVCKKYFWTPTSMRLHKRKQHGTVNELVYGGEP